VFTGPYRVTQFRKDDRIELEPNPSYPLPNRRAPVVVRKLVDAQARALALESGEADLAFQLPPESLERLRARGFAVKSTLVGYQYLLFLNGKRPGLSEQPVRQAIDLAINRAALVTALRGGETATGFYPNFYRFASREPRAYDPARANRLLEESGWQRGADGLRTKDADRLAFPAALAGVRDQISSAPPPREALRVRLPRNPRDQRAESGDSRLWQPVTVLTEPSLFPYIHRPRQLIIERRTGRPSAARPDTP